MEAIIIEPFESQLKIVKTTIAWLTDLHLNYVGRSEIGALCESISLSGADAALVTGDIATAEHLSWCLKHLADSIQIPIYFVLGNHDYYGSSIQRVNFEVGGIVISNHNLIWLSRSGVIELTPDTCLIGHEGLADGRLGEPEGSTVMLNDYYNIRELSNLTKGARLEAQHKLGDEAAEHLKLQLCEAVSHYHKIIVALHVPPYPEACWYEGKMTDANFLPHFGCRATGDVLRSTMLIHPEVSMTVYCGHTHSCGVAQILPNLKVITGGAEYCKPRITDIIKL